MTVLRMSADKIIKELGISEPSDIDIEAIAQYCSATVVYEKLTGCEARIVGNADRAIITVNSESRRGRQRFSAAHELGHWMRDRNRVGFSCTNALFRSQWGSLNPERGANEYAADLLMPQSIFGRYSYASPVTMDAVRKLAMQFDTSLAATAIRLVQYGSFPAMVIFLEQGVRKWFVAGPDVPRALWPRETPSGNTVAGEILRGGNQSPKPESVKADGWMMHSRSEWYEVIEDSVKFRDGSILSLLWWKDEKQIVDLMDDE
jgi:hypothetical protein